MEEATTDRSGSRPHNTVRFGTGCHKWHMVFASSGSPSLVQDLSAVAAESRSHIKRCTRNCVGGQRRRLRAYAVSAGRGWSLCIDHWRSMRRAMSSVAHTEWACQVLQISCELRPVTTVAGPVHRLFHCSMPVGAHRHILCCVFFSVRLHSPGCGPSGVIRFWIGTAI